ncbi:MAG: inorganic diphosphatase [Balneolales bacterium]|nr:inorganic diphosphatase [Balneolales bacterium]
MISKNFVLIILVTIIVATACEQQPLPPSESDFIITTHDFLRGFDPNYNDSLVNIVVEIPAGDNQKWEVDKETGYLMWEAVSSDSFRVVSYLPYPANYGMIPRTLLPVELGGDGDPIDIFLLGKRLDRGSVVPGSIIGVIKMTDRGEQDDKLIAVDPSGWFGHIQSIGQLNEEYPGIISIITTFMENYKGEGYVEGSSVGDRDEALSIFTTSVEHFIE